MNILFLLSSNKYSGAENVACQIAAMFRTEHEFCFTYCSPRGQICEVLAEKDIKYEPIEEMSVSEVTRVIALIKPDIVHAHDMRASLIGAIACGKTRFISHIHNNNFENRHINKKTLAYLIPALKASDIIWVSKSSYNGYTFSSLFKRKSTILYNVIDTIDLFEKTKLDSNKYNYDIIYVGRLTSQKDPTRLLKVISLAINKNKNLRVGIVGDGDMMELVKREWHNLGLEDNVDIIGFCSNPTKMMQTSKVMLMTSLWEGTPMCALEAMALGVPIVSTPTDGLVDLIEHNVNGFLSDSDDELATFVADIASDSDLHDRLSGNMITKSSIFNDVDLYKSRLLEIYLKS